MALIEEIGFTVLEGQEEAFQQWLLANEQQLRESAPAGVRYLGTYGVVFSSEKQAGSYRLLLELDGYAAIDTLSEAMKDAVGDFGRLVREHAGFTAYDPNLPWSQSLYRTVGDMAVFDVKPPKNGA